MLRTYGALITFHIFIYRHTAPAGQRKFKTRRYQRNWQSLMKRNKTYHLLFCFLIFCLADITALSQSGVPYTDRQHYSTVFGHDKSYRIYLPEEYESSNKKYPVIYFFHGWGGRHFKDDNALLNYEGIKLLADKYQSILVMWDGNIDTTEPRPYNIGNHNDVKFTVQEKDYFPELIEHIDSSYRTLTDRQHRGIIGFSMGGFMSFFLAGKYPDKVIAAVSLAGSPEFFVGYPANHTLYPIRYTFKNLSDVKIRMHNGDSDILYYLNDEVKEGAKWEGIDLDYWKFSGGHMVDKTGETKVFEMAMKFVANAFSKPVILNTRWSHYDLYPSFSVWGYSFKTNKKEPGYLFVKNAEKKGFGFYTKKWLPDGPSLAIDTISITTAPLYTAGKTYNILRYEAKTGKLKTTTQQANAGGSLSFFFNNGETETGIYDNKDSSSFVFIDYTTNKKSRYLHNQQTGTLSLRLLNRGNTIYPTGKIKVTLSTTDDGITIKKNTVEAIVKAGQHIVTIPAFTIVSNKKAPLHAEPPQVKFKLHIQNGKQSFSDDFIVPVLYETPLLDSIQVDDQVTIRGSSYGKGNSNSIADAGENIMLYSGTHRLRLYTEDKWVLNDEETLADEMIPARWPDGYTLSSIIKISPACPDGHVIELYASYETKNFNPIERKTTWGKVKLTIHNNGSAKK
jgi:enterochelin esterase-like enzyme